LQPCQNVGGVERGRRSRPSETEPRAAYWRRSIYSPVMRRLSVFYVLYYYSIFSHIIIPYERAVKPPYEYYLLPAEGGSGGNAPRIKVGGA
jgi:hypothetical protein